MYDVLIDPEKRTKYDVDLAAQRAKARMMSGMRAPEPAPHNTSNGMEKAAAAAAAAKRKADAAAWNESHKTPKMGRSKSSTSPPSAEGAILYQAFAGALHSFSRHARLRHTVQPGRRF